MGGRVRNRICFGLYGSVWVVLGLVRLDIDWVGAAQSDRLRYVRVENGQG